MIWNSDTKQMGKVFKRVFSIRLHHCLLLIGDNWCRVSPVVVLTDGLHHAGLSCVSLDWNDILETMQRDDALPGIPHLKDMLHFGAQILSQRRKRQYFIHRFYFIVFIEIKQWSVCAALPWKSCLLWSTLKPHTGGCRGESVSLCPHKI